MRSFVIGILISGTLFGSSVFSNEGTLLVSTEHPEVEFLSASSDVAAGAYPIFVVQPGIKGHVLGKSIYGNLAAYEVLSINGSNIGLDAGLNIQGIVARINEFTGATQIEASVCFIDKIRLASVEFGGSCVVVSTGTGAGFATSVQFGAGQHVVGSIGFDYDIGDGDVLCASEIELRIASGGSVETASGFLGTITIQRCAGALFQRQDLIAGDQPRTVAVDDFNGDGHVDLATANILSDEISVFLGNGDGTFANRTRYSVGNGPFAVVSGDFDADGTVDLATANNLSNDVSVLLGSGDGTFLAGNSIAVGNGPNSIVSADLNGDGAIDLATANGLSANLSVLYGVGDGTFEISQIASELLPNSVIAGDIDADGDVDLSIANALSGSVTVFENIRNEGFASDAYDVGQFPVALSMGDFNGDQVIELAIVNGFSNEIAVLVDIGFGNYVTVETDAVDRPEAIANLDINQDGIDDLVITNVVTDEVFFFLGNGNSMGFPASNIQVGEFPGSVCVADLNDDGAMDLITANRDSNTLSILLNNSCGSGSVLLGDVNLDGTVDLLDVSPFVIVLDNGGFQSQADVNEDGVVDLLDISPFVNLLTQ